MILRSIRAKLVAVYVIIVLVFVSVLAVVLSFSYKKNLIEVREKEILDCGKEIATMYEEGQLGVVAMESGENVPVLRTTAKDFDATIQLVNTESKRIYYVTDEDGVQVLENDLYVDKEIYRQVFEENSVYLKSDYVNSDLNKRVSTVAMPIYRIMHTPNEKPWAILIIHSDLTTVYKAFNDILKILWIPAVVIILLGFAATFFCVDRFARRIKALNAATGEIAKGRFDQRVKVKGKDEISQLGESFNKMAEELAISDASKKDFVSNAAHELRSPMTSINGFITGMLDGTIPQKEQPKYLEIVLSEVKRLTKLVNSMLDLSRIESGRVKFAIQKCDINELVRRVVIRLSQKIEEKGILPEIELDGEHLFVMADADKIEEVLQNLIDNAIKFTPSGKKLFISTQIDGYKVLVTVRDEGVGISDEEIKFIWNRFYTVDKARTGHKNGTGLGLSIVKSIIEQHNQRIWVKSKQGKGTEFVFTLDCYNE